MNSGLVLIIVVLLIFGALICGFFFARHRGKSLPSAEKSNPEENEPEAPDDGVLPESVNPQIDSIEIIDEQKELSPPEASEISRSTIKISIHDKYPVRDDMPPQLLELLDSQTSALPKLPNVAIDILPTLAQPGAGLKQVARIIEKDQATAARLLRWVNSSLFGLDGKVESLHRAVTILGLDTVRSAVLEDAFSRKTQIAEIEGLNMSIVWRHATAVSIASRHLARSVRGMAPDVAATAGLLHDIGILLMMLNERSRIESAVKEAKESCSMLIYQEGSIFGFNHQVCGETLVRTWRLPDLIATSVGWHHSPMREPFDPMAAVIWLSDYMVSRMGFSCPEYQIPYCEGKEIEELMARIGLRPPLERLFTEALIREIIHGTKLWEPAAVNPESVVFVN